MAIYSIYNTNTGEILRRVTCPQNMIQDQLGEEENYVDGDFDDTQYKISGKKPTKFTQKEIETKIFSERLSIPFPKRLLNPEMTDEELEVVIGEYYLGMIDVNVWRIENYSFLRECFYPPGTEVIDAQVKIRKGISGGQEQLDKYDEKCLSVKNRFPKTNGEN